jgi:hypothetical protein
MTFVCIGESNSHCMICRAVDRCCLAPGASSWLPTRAATYRPSAAEVETLRSAIASEAGSVVSLADLLRAELILDVRVVPTTPPLALPPGAPPAIETFLTHQKEVEHVQAPRSPR